MGSFIFGSSKDIMKRLKKHFSDLKYNKHINSYLQNAFNLYDENVWLKDIVEECPNDEKILLETEQKWLDKTKPYIKGVGYNICIKAGRLNIVCLKR